MDQTLYVSLISLISDGLTPLTSLPTCRLDSFTRNLIAGERYLEHVGELVIRSTTSKDKVVLDFRAATMWESSRNIVLGTIHSHSPTTGRTTLTKLRGNWSDQVALQLSEVDEYRVLWRANPFPDKPLLQYGFTSFAITLNELPTNSEELPLTDSRFRPDQRAFENGQVAKADELKLGVEEGQRERRKARESDGSKFEPRWFKLDEAGEWKAKVGEQGYWNSRGVEGFTEGGEVLWK